MPSSLLPLWRRIAPILTLLILAPFVAEILEGSTHLTNLFVFPSEVGVYGCAALLIRAFVRSERKGWTTLLLLGIAYAVTEECVILQTSLYPLFVADPQHVYGRLLGVNWIYLLWAVGYESVWGIVLPIQLSELLFPERRDDPWLGKVGLIITAIFFLLASFVAWRSWMLALSKFASGLHYQPPLLTIVVALIVIVALVAIALALPASLQTAHKSTSARRAPRPWLVGVVAFVLALPWFAPLLLHYGVFPAFPFALALVLILAWVAGVFWLIRHWSATQGWGDGQRLALIFGAVLASMLAGFLFSGIVLPIDFIWKGVCDLLALLALAYLAWKIRRRMVVQAEASMTIDTTLL